LFNFLSLTVSLLNSFNLWLKFNYFVFQLCLFGFKFFNFLLKISLSMFSLKLLAHSECNWALVQCLICSNSHFNFVAHSEKKKTTLRLVESHLSNDLIETLGEKLLSYRAYTGLTGLTLHKFLIEHFSQTRYINSSCFLMRNILNVVLASLNPLSGRKDGIQNVFSWGLWLHRWKLCLLFWSYKERRLVKRFYLFYNCDELWNMH